MLFAREEPNQETMDLRRLQVRLRSPWTQRIETRQAVFDRDLPPDEADALLCEWAPDPELFTFPRRKAWYCCEPTCQFRSIERGDWPAIRAKLQPYEFLWHGHPDPRYRVPHQTHFETLVPNENTERMHRAVAIVSNHGGNPLFAHPDLKYRNRLITSTHVDLFGRSGWRKYRRSWYSLPTRPSNYQGELPGDWHAAEKRQLMSRYKVCVCLENMNEPGYFTEKFVEAVIAGCIPVYRASADIRDTVLQGALWFDPSDPRWPEEKSIEAALEASLTEIHLRNADWLTSSSALAATHANAIFEKISRSLASRDPRNAE